MAQRDATVYWGWYATGVYGAFVRIGEQYSQVRNVDWLHLDADEGMQLNSSTEAQAEAQRIARRNGLPYGGKFANS